jgi:hypothetical protein
VTIGSTINDSATLSGGYGTLNGTISFSVFAPDDTTCTTPISVNPNVSVSGAGVYPSASYTATAIGDYRWIASYSGDTNNMAVSTNCADLSEISTVNKAVPVLTTTASGPVLVGSAITDTAHLSGGYGTLSGTLTFNVYAPGDETCATPLSPTPASATVNGANDYTSGPFTTATFGSYRWMAHYSGNANNTAVDTACNDAGEISSVISINAVDDDGGTISQATGGTAVANVLANDTLNGAQATTSTVTLTIVGTWPNGITLDTGTGAASVAAGTEAGTYTPQYQICDKANPTFCDVATVTVQVQSPPAVSITHFEAVRIGSDRTALRWETVFESGMVGFNLYRLAGFDSMEEQVNDSLIPAKFLDSMAGGFYTYFDDSAPAGTAYVYRLEYIDTNLQPNDVGKAFLMDYSIFLPVLLSR